MMNSTEEETVVASLRERDADLAQKIIDEMFVFDNLLDVEDRAIQLILKEIDNDTLMVALKGAQEELRAKFLRNMSSRAAEMLREDLEAQGPIHVQGRGRAEEDPADRPPPGRERPDRAGQLRNDAYV